MRSLDWKQLVGKIIHGNICLCLVMKELSIFNAQRSTSFQILYCVLARFSKTPNRTMHGNKRLGWLKIFSKLQKLWQNRWRATGIRVEYFPRIQYVAAQWRSQKFTVEITWDTSEFHRKNHIYVDVQRHFLWIKRQWKRMPGECQTRFSVCKEIWKRTMVIHWSWFWKEVVRYQWRQSTRSMGQYGWKDVVGIRRKWMSNFPHYEPIVQRSTQKQRTWENVYTLCSRFGNDWNYFSHNCLQISSVFTKQSRRYVKSMKPFMKELGDPLSWGNQVPHSCWVWLRHKYLFIVMTRPIKIFYCSNMENELKKLSQQDRLSKFCMDAGFLNVVEIGQYFMTKDTAEFSQFHAVACREYTLSKRRRSITTKKDGSKIGPVLEFATSYLHGKHGVEIRIIVSEQRQDSLLGQNFSWIKQVCDEFEQQRQKFQKFSSKNMR